MSVSGGEIDIEGLRKPAIDRLRKRIRHGVGRAVADFGMIEAGDRIMVCLSGGADSYTMLDALLGLQRVAPVDFELIAVNLDQKQPGFPERVLPEYLESIGVQYRVVEEDTHSIVQRVIPAGKTTCSLCSRLRRGVLYRTAGEIGASKIALGHHADDIVETAFLNMFHNSRLKAMPPKLRSDDGRHVVIRPLAYLRETTIKQYAAARDFPIIPCNLCGSQPNLQRQAIKAMGRGAPGPGRQYPQVALQRDPVSPARSPAIRFRQPLGSQLLRLR